MIGVLEPNGAPLSEDLTMNPPLRRAFDCINDGPQDTKYDLPFLETLRQRSLRSVTDVQSLHSWPPEDTPHRSFQKAVSLNENSLYSMHETQSEENIHRLRSLRRDCLFAPLLMDMETPPLQRRPSLKDSLSKNERSLYSRSITPPPKRLTPTRRRGLDGHLQVMKAPDLVPESLHRPPSLQKRQFKSERSFGSPRSDRITPRRRGLDSPLRDMDTPTPSSGGDPPMMTPPQRRLSLKKHQFKRERSLRSGYHTQSEIITPRRRSFDSLSTDMKVSSDDELITTPPRRPSIERRASTINSSFRAKYEMPPEKITPRYHSLQLARPLDAPLKDAEWAKAAQTSTLYRHAKEQAWEEVSVDCKTHKDDASYVFPMDGTTALHLAVMSRVGYSFKSEEKAKHPAPLSLVEELLQVYPDAAKVPCQVNTYTPLAYACLVSGPECCLEEMNEMVRLFLQYSPESTSVYTSGGLSAVDVHIVSYSQVMAGRTDKRMRLSGRTSTVVLRTLLEHDPKLANVRISNDKLGGAIEILYRCNSQAFMKIVAEYETKRRQHNRIMTSETEDKNKRVLAKISNWWVWQWTVLILKYGTLPKKKKGARFFALQAASGLVGCPLPILTLAMAAFPNQIKEVDEMHGTDGNLPLHEVCSWPQQSAAEDPVIATRKGMAITALVQRYPNAAFVCNSRGESPLDLALSTGTTWDGGIRKLVRTYPASASIRSSATGLYPFMTAAAVAASSDNASDLVLPSSKQSLMTHLKNEAKRDLQTVRTIYGLLRADPDVMLPADEEESDNDDDCLSDISHDNAFNNDDNGFVSSSELDWSGLLSTAQSIREEAQRWAHPLGETDTSFRQSVRNLNYKSEEDDDMGGYDLKRIGYL